MPSLLHGRVAAWSSSPLLSWCDETIGVSVEVEHSDACTLIGESSLRAEIFSQVALTVFVLSAVVFAGVITWNAGREQERRFPQWLWFVVALLVTSFIAYLLLRE